MEAELIRGIIETQVIRALNEAPEAVEKLVKAALSRPVDENGKFDGYHGNKLPYLDYIVGQEIRNAAENAVRKIVMEQSNDIEEMVRRGLSSESVIAAVTNSLVGAAKEEWRINVSFEAQPKRY